METRSPAPTDPPGRPVPTGPDRTARRGHRFGLIVVIVPLAMVAFGWILSNVLSRVVGNDVVDGAVEVNGWSFIASFVGVFSVVFSVVNAVMQRFPTERARYEPWPLTCASASLAFTSASAAFAPTTSTPVVLAAALPAAVLAGFAGFRIARSVLPPTELPVSHAPAPPGVLRHRADAAMTPIWSGRAPAHDRRVYLWGLLYLAIGVMIVVVGLAGGGSGRSNVARVVGVSGVFIIQVVILTAKFKSMQVRVAVGPAGLLVRSGTTGRVMQAIDLDHIASAWYTDAPRPNLLTGYGKQSSDRRLSYVTRGGPALLVKLTGGGDVVVSLDEPEEVAGVLNDLLDRRATDVVPTVRSA